MSPERALYRPAKLSKLSQLVHRSSRAVQMRHVSIDTIDANNGIANGKNKRYYVSIKR